MLDRDHELMVFQQALTDAVSGRGSLVLVAGEAGIGKTTLINAFCDLAARSGVRVLAGGCDDLLAPPTLGPLREAVRGRPGPLAEALVGGDPERVLGAVVEELASASPTVLIVEDVHWADDATIDVLRYLVPRAKRLAAVLVISLRDQRPRPGDRLEQLVAAIASSGSHRLALSPLSREAVEELAARAGQPATELLELTGGNPFYVTEVLAGPLGELPTTVADTVLARLHRLSPRASRALEQLSVMPTGIGVRLAEELLGGEFDRLAEAEEARMIEMRRGSVYFRHELARRVVEASVPAIRRRAYHRAVVAALRSQAPQDVLRLVHHAVSAEDAETVVAAAPDAAREAARAGSHRQALALFEAVLRYRSRLSATDLACVLDDYAWELYNAHRFEEAVTAGRAATELYERLGQPLACGQALVRLSRHLYMTGRTDDAAVAVARAIELLEPTPAVSALADALTQQGALLALTGQAEPAVAILDRARVLADQASRPDLVALSLNYLGMAVCELHGSQGLSHLRHSLKVALSSGAHEFVARGYTNLGEMLYRFARYDELARCLDAGLDFTRERGFWSHAYNLELHRCLLLVRHSRWDEAESALRRLVDGVHDPGMLYVYSVPPLARLLARRGAPDAQSMLQPAWARAVAQKSVLGIAYAGIAYAEWAWLCDRTDGLAEVVEVVLAATQSPGCAALRAEFLRYLSRVGWEGPDPPDGEGTHPWTAGQRGDWRSAAAAWGRLGDDYERALELAESNDKAQMLEALRLLGGLGAQPAEAIVRRRMKKLGMVHVPRGPMPLTRANPAGLTDRQLDVLSLLAEDLTNAEIAQKLCLSVRTVDHHVSAILNKLGVSTRRAARAAAHGPAEAAGLVHR